MRNKQAKLLTRIIVGVVAALSCSLSVRADTLNVSFATPDQTGSPGDTLVFFGTISNPGSTQIFINSDNLSTGQPFLIGDDSKFISDTPASLAAGANTGNVDLFSVMIGASATPGTYTMNNFLKVLGGSTSGAQDLLATQQFSITVAAPASVPEPGTMALLGTGMTGWMARAVRRRQNKNTRTMRAANQGRGRILL